MPVPATELARLFQLDTLRPETRDQLAREAMVSDYQRGENVFEAGDLDDDTVYLLDGELKCNYPDGRSVSHIASAPHGRYSLNDAIPRRFTAKVVSGKARVMRLDRRYLEKLITWDQLSRDENYRHFGGAPGGNNWVFRLLRAPAFARLPTGNIEKMFQMFEPVTVKPSEIVMREGDAPDYFYVVREGTASVSKYLDGAPQVVAYLREGDTFGEDALLSNLPRNATVRMMQGGQLMRLSREAFEAVLKPPMLSWVLPAEAARLVHAGAALLDVRMPEEHAQRAIDGSVNVPLYRLREDVANVLPSGSRVIVYCNTGERSAAAAFVLKRLGYEVSALHGGLGAMLRLLAANTPA
ncbi:cyclic nucleotide-binding domain-containing protein [Arenimonas terrae]|uniref:Cyclic nucleotide-binding domain-containing protein n=1 Tax=Arenimonas terrae TaxID=2546226 RepID=A0A5C4RX72_9GAMM|nr:cyclic nucleotide-binding domain-containing protein [Arenimonas terrae]TNJ35578.1 cyclic nucleotide-binding domain-containing protein [Arenimonas terrae]